MKIKRGKVKAAPTAEGYKIKISMVETSSKEVSCSSHVRFGPLYTFIMELTVEQAWQVYAALGKELKAND